MSRTQTKAVINSVTMQGFQLPKIAPAAAGITGRWAHDYAGGAIRSRFEFQADTLVFDVGADNTDLADGINIIDLPAGFYHPIMGRFKGSLKNSLALGENANGELGVGTVVGSGAVATLSTATFENFMLGTAITAITAGATVDQNIANATIVTPVLGSASAATSLFLNIAAAFSNEAAAHKIVITKDSILELIWAGVPADVAKA